MGHVTWQSVQTIILGFLEFLVEEVDLAMGDSKTAIVFTPIHPF